MRDRLQFHTQPPKKKAWADVYRREVGWGAAIEEGNAVGKTKSTWTKADHRRLVTLGLAAFVLSSCATQARNPFDGSPGNNSPVMVEVENGLFHDVRIYVVHGSSRHRIGTVSSLASTTLRLPRGILGSGQGIRLLADPIGSNDRYSTQSMTLDIGARIGWSIVPGMSTSVASIWR